MRFWNNESHIFLTNRFTTIFNIRKTQLRDDEEFPMQINSRCDRKKCSYRIFTKKMGIIMVLKEFEALEMKSKKILWREIEWWIDESISSAWIAWVHAHVQLMHKKSLPYPIATKLQLSSPETTIDWVSEICKLGKKETATPTVRNRNNFDKHIWAFTYVTLSYWINK